MPSFPFYHQHDAMDCGPACLRMISAFYGKKHTLQSLREKSYITREGVSLLGISDAAESIGFKSLGIKITKDQLINEIPLPCIAHWKQNHFVVIHDIKKPGLFRKKAIFKVADPAFGLIKQSEEEFLSGWYSVKEAGQDKGVCLILEPTASFYEHDDEKTNKAGFGYLFSYLRTQKKFVVQLILGLLFGSLIQLIFPFLTQAIVDIGINNQDIGFIYLILIAHLVLFAGRVSVELIRNWILLHLTTRVNISLISDFLLKLMKLPIRFFDSKMTGDLLQRINDHIRIESFLTSSSLSVLLSMVSLVVFGFVLAIYNLKILFVFILGSVIYLLWINIFMKRRRELDFRKFSKMADNQEALIQLFTGMQEIKLNNCETRKRWEWENIQAGLFRVNIKRLALNQNQQSGALFINETKNIIITFLSAIAVINGDMTLGMLVAVQFIIGQLNAPLEQMINFFHTAQDAKISLERLAEIHNLVDEQVEDKNKVTILPLRKSIEISELSFQYEGPHSPYVLNAVNLVIPENKVTAIVGVSGSGKTTLVKLMLGFYQPVKGDIKIGGVNLKNINRTIWRQNCGVVMQDGFIFSDSIAKNIAVGEDDIDTKRLLNAVNTANIIEFIESLPLGYNTKIGANGIGISQGQKQRILIARAVYKNPGYLFFDEATNALDAENESIIMENLGNFFAGKTVVVVAHRLSTVRDADQIVVLHQGELAELGTHDELVNKQGIYFHLVRNQLELGGE